MADENIELEEALEEQKAVVEHIEPTTSYYAHIWPVDHIKTYFKNHKIILDDETGTFSQRGMSMTKDQVVAAVTTGMMINSKFYARKRVDDLITGMVIATRQRAISGLRNNLAFDSAAESELGKLLEHLLAPSDTRPLQKAVLLHWMRNVKRTILNLPREWEIMPVIYGAQGSGKTQTLRRLLSPLSRFVQEPSLETMHGKFDQKPLSQKYVLFFDELVGTKDIPMSAFKKAMDSEYVEGRNMLSEDSSSPKRIANFIASTNSAPPHGLYDDTGSRRLFSILAAGEKGKRNIPTGERGLYLRTFDAHAIWRAVDPEAPSELLELHMDALAEAQQATQSKTFMEAFLEDCTAVAEGEKIQFGTFVEGYRTYLTGRGMRPKLPAHPALREELQKLGLELGQHARSWFVKDRTLIG